MPIQLHYADISVYLVRFLSRRYFNIISFKSRALKNKILVVWLSIKKVQINFKAFGNITLKKKKKFKTL